MLNLCTLVTFLANVLSVSAVLPNMNFRKCRTLDNTLRITVFASVSLNECIEECLLRIQCQSMNYRRASQLCELYSNTYGGKSANNGVTQGGPCVLILREDITTSQNPRSCFCPNKEICRSENLECPASQYLGCYQDDVNRTLLDANHKHDNFMTIEMCLLQCIGYTYAAPQWYRHCFCGDILDTSLNLPDYLCSTPCEGNPAQMCGGYYCGSVYAIFG